MRECCEWCGAPEGVLCADCSGTHGLLYAAESGLVGKGSYVKGSYVKVFCG